MAPGYQDPDCTVFVSNIEARVSEEHLWELFLQAGPLRNIHIPFDKGTGKSKSFGFVTYRDECSVLYACELFNSLRLFKKPIYCKPTKDGKQAQSANTPQTSGSPQFITPQRPGVFMNGLNTGSPNSNGGYSPSDDTGGNKNRRDFFSNDRNSRRQYNEQFPTEDVNRPLNEDAVQKIITNAYQGQRGHRSPRMSSEDELLRYDLRADDRNGRFEDVRISRHNDRNPHGDHRNGRYDDGRGSRQNDREPRRDDRNGRYDNRRYSGGNSPSSPSTNSGNLSPFFIQAVNQSINNIRRESNQHDRSPRNDSSHFGPMRSDPIPRHREIRRNRSQPY